MRSIISKMKSTLHGINPKLNTAGGKSRNNPEMKQRD
jgi:hypothetical protein